MQDKKTNKDRPVYATAKIEGSVLQRARLYAVHHRVMLRDVCTEAVQAWLDGVEKAGVSR